MTDKELIKQEIEKQIDYAEDDTRYTESYREGLIAAYQTIKAFIDSLPEEPVKETIKGNYNERYKRIAQTEQFKKTYCDKSLGKEDSASEDLEEEITKCYKSRNDLMMTRKQFGELIHHFAEWQKQQMMKDSTEAQVYPTERPDLVEICPDGIILDETKFQSGDKVKIIIVKEE